MSERQARCSCGKTRPSSERDRLPFFEDRSESSRQARIACKICRAYAMAHEPREDGSFPSVIGKPHAFEPHGAFEFDLYYCGCRGWD
jgi:hypothetical protein